MRTWWCWLFLWACSGEGSGSPGGPGAPVDAAAADGAEGLDAAALDAAREPEAGRPDARVGDAGRLDASLEAGAPDAAREDAAPDAIRPDGAPRDAQPADAGPLDQGPVDAAPPREACFNGEDDDGDGRIDCADPDCRRSGACFEHLEDCANGRDDNGDDRVDCDDVRCLSECPPSAAGPMQEAEIQAVFDAWCVRCHGESHLALLDLRAPFTADTVGVPSSEVRGLRIAPGRRADSYLYRKLAFTFRDVNGGGGEGMPPLPDPPLPAEVVDRIGQWIDALPP